MEDVQTILERPALYENVDGSSELMLGCMMIGFTVFGWVGSSMRVKIQFGTSSIRYPSS